MRGLDLLAAPGGTLLLEVPDFGAIGARGDLSAIWEQHVNYFDQGVLERLAGAFGWVVRRLESVPHGGGALVAFLQRGPAAPCAPPPSREPWREAFGRTRTGLRALVGELRGQGLRLAAFGAGMRGTMLVNLCGIGSAFEAVLDDHPGKTGRFLPGSGLPVRPSLALEQDPPDLCFVLPLNAKEAERAVMERFPGFRAAGGRFVELFPAEGGVAAIRA
jgi:hypothetical protein